MGAVRSARWWRPVLLFAHLCRGGVSGGHGWRQFHRGGHVADPRDGDPRERVGTAHGDLHRDTVGDGRRSVYLEVTYLGQTADKAALSKLLFFSTTGSPLFRSFTNYMIFLVFFYDLVFFRLWCVPFTCTYRVLCCLEMSFE